MSPPSHAGARGAPAGTDSLLRDLWESKAWRLFPLLLVYLSGVTLLAAHVPTLTTDYFASRRAGEALHCEDYAGREGNRLDIGPRTPWAAHTKRLSGPWGRDWKPSGLAQAA